MSAVLTPDLKARAMNALGRLTVQPVANGWSAHCSRVEVRRRGFLASAVGFGHTPDAAIEALWRHLVDEIDGEYLVIEAMTDKRRAVRWNGFMWESATEEAAS